MKLSKKKFVYLISPVKINKSFFSDLVQVLKQKKVSFFQLRLKKNSFKKKLLNNNDKIEIVHFIGGG